MSKFSLVINQAQRDRIIKDHHADLILAARRRDLEALALEADIQLDGRRNRKEKTIKASGFQG